MATVIQVNNLSKQYRLGSVGTGSLAHDVNRAWHRLCGNEDPYLKIGEENDRAQKSNSEYVWALKDINFELNQGEVMGIIGRNGAGKSTLLKILSRTTSPTTGSVKIKGKVASLLEVGTGFHPELSGRENIYLNGAIMGMAKSEIKSKFDEIVDFAGVERYIDSPVKRYSSGMYVRLAFGVAAHLEPDILIVDEVLAVGDAEFQKKALGKMKDVSKKEGRTVLFVSHNMAAITSLCNTAILLNDGRLNSVGTVKQIIDKYLAVTDNVAIKKYEGIGVIKKATILSDKNFIEYGDSVAIEVYFETLKLIKSLVLGIVVKDINDIQYFGINNKHYSEIKLNDKDVSSGLISVSIPTLKLLPGFYKIDLHLGDTSTDLEIIENAFYFNVENTKINSTSLALDYRINKIYLKDVKWNYSKL